MIGKSSALGGMERLLRDNYSLISRDQDERLVSAVEALLSRINKRTEPVQSVLVETVRTIHRSSDFQYIAIVLRGSDGMYRYKYASCVSDESKKALFSICYSLEDILDESSFPHISVSDITKFFMSENQPYRPGEVMCFPRPTMLSENRERPDDMLEGDYIEFFLRNPSKEILGFIEVGEPRSGKLPKRGAIVWLELIATLLGVVLCDRLEDEDGQ